MSLVSNPTSSWLTPIAIGAVRAKAAMTAIMGVSDSEPILSMRGLLSTFTDLLRTMFFGGTIVISAGRAVMLNRYT